jgi:hypothetical protein
VPETFNNLAFVSTFEKVPVCLCVNVHILKALTEQVSQLLPFVASMCDDALYHSLSSQFFSLFKGELADVNEKVIYSAIVSHLLHVLHKVDFQNVDDKIFLSKV